MNKVSMPLTAITLSNFPNTKIYQRYLDESGSVRMSTTELQEKVLEDATKNPANYRNKLYSLDLQCMGRQ